MPLRFAHSGDVQIAYDVVGDGPIDVVYVQGFVTHLDSYWELPAYRDFCQRIGEFARLIRFDKRGTGMSDRVPGATTWETRMDDIRAILDDLGSERAAVIGESEGGPLGMLFAAAHPERTEALILQGAEVRERTDEAWPWGEATPEEFQRGIDRIPEMWGQPIPIGSIVPGLADEAWASEWFGKAFRNAGTPNTIEAFQRMAYEIDVRDVAPLVKVPTLIFHATGDRVCHVENARFLAQAIEGSRLVERESDDHVPWFGDADDFIAELREFLTGERGAAVVDRVLATVLFTDIVGSTQRAADVGDRRWRELLAEHHRIVRRALDSHGGREIDMAGDGVLATFDGPARAIRCAQAMQHGTAPLGLELRAGVHTGEIELIGEDVAGITVHVGARVAAAARARQIWVSDIVRQLTAGSGIEFRDEGSHQLRGVPAEQHLFSVA